MLSICGKRPTTDTPLRAARLVRPGSISVDEVPDPSPGSDEVLVRVGGVGLCGSDLSLFRGDWTAPDLPWILGHEAFGLIEAVGEEVPIDRVGERVVIEPNIPCLRCDQCQGGRPSGCRQRRSVGMNRPGALAEKLVVPSPFAWRIALEQATDLVCIEPLTVVETALRRLAIDVPAAALVVGVGPQGLLMCLALARRGVEVHALDLNPDRVAVATTLGAREFSGEAGRRFDLVVDSVGTPASMRTALDHSGTGGTLLVLGIDSRPVEISSAMLVRRQLVLRGSLTYDHPADFRSVIDLVETSHLAPGRIVTDEYPLADVQRAFESAGSARGKTWVRIDSSV
jgi:threonine dehydrogenase-like Zn-dependent dehydrogenase